MGWNQGFTVFEKTVIDLYDCGILTKDILTIVMEQYRDTDIDNGGCMDLETKDGKDIVQVVIETWGLQYPIFNKKFEDCSDNEKNEQCKQIGCLWDSITSQFGWLA